MGKGKKGILGNEEKRGLVMAIGNLEGIHGGEEDDLCFWFSEAERGRERREIAIGPVLTMGLI